MNGQTKRCLSMLVGFVVVLCGAPQAKMLEPGDSYTDTQPVFESHTRESIYIDMSDGARIAADIYLPTGFKGKTKQPHRFPTVLVHTPYTRTRLDPNTGEIANSAFDLTGVKGAEGLLPYGYAVVVSETRGTGASSGSSLIFGHRYQLDAAEVVNWIEKQGWSSGKVGMVGASHVGWTQLAAAAHKPRALKAIMPSVLPSEAWTGQFFPGGIFMYSFLTGEGRSAANQAIRDKTKHLLATPVVDEDNDGELLDEIPLDLNNNGNFVDDYSPGSEHWPPQYRDGSQREHIHYFAFYNRPGVPFIDYDGSPYLDTKSVTGESARDMAANLMRPISETDVAIYNIAGWYDAFTRGTVEYFATLQPTNPSRLMIMPGFHAVWNGFMYDLYGATGFDLLFRERLRFFDHYLKGLDNGFSDEPPVLIYNMMGDGWRQEQTWPLAREQRTTLFFNQNNKLSREQPARGSDSYRVVLDHDRRFGENTSSRWTAILGNLYPRGEPDMTEQDKESLVYDTAVLEQDTEITGHPIVKLWVSSTASDGDFFVFLEDVDENGKSLMVTEGMLRAGWADLHDNDLMTDTGIEVLPELPWHGYDKSQWKENNLAGGEVLELVIDLQPTSWTFKTGHKLRIAITGANYPDFSLNPVLSPSNNPHARDNVVPTIKLHRGGAYPSLIELPVIPR